MDRTLYYVVLAAPIWLPVVAGCVLMIVAWRGTGIRWLGAARWGYVLDGFGILTLVCALVVGLGTMIVLNGGDDIDQPGWIGYPIGLSVFLLMAVLGAMPSVVYRRRRKGFEN